MQVSTPGCGSGELMESIVCLRDVTVTGSGPGARSCRTASAFGHPGSAHNRCRFPNERGRMRTDARNGTCSGWCQCVALMRVRAPSYVYGGINMYAINRFQDSGVSRSVRFTVCCHVRFISSCMPQLGVRNHQGQGSVSQYSCDGWRRNVDLRVQEPFSLHALHGIQLHVTPTFQHMLLQFLKHLEH
jgi:hypothetical protein